MPGHQGTSTRRDVNEYLAALPETERADINTTFVGHAVKYDSKTQTATVQPRLSMKIGGETVRAPELQEIPVQHPRFGNFIIHGPLKDKDELRLDVVQRSLEQSVEDGSDIDNNRGRMHNLSDAVATPSSYSKGKRASNMPSDRVHIGTDDGKSGLQMKEDGSFDMVRNGDSLWKVIEDLATALRDHTNNGAPNDQKAQAQAILDRIGKIKAT